MKAFEKWAHYYTGREYEVAKAAWKAALEWAYKQAHEEYATDIGLAIEEELEL